MGKGIIFAALALLIASSEFAELNEVEFHQLGESLWIHESFELYGGQRTSSNGLIVLSRDSAILIDTAWNDEETRRVIEFTRHSLGREIGACILTHAHPDRDGGLGEISRNGTRIYMTRMTAALLRKENRRYEYLPLPDGRMRLEGLTLDVRYFGAAHSPDNITVWLPEQGALFGGCILKSMGSASLGNKAEADLRNWPLVLDRLDSLYGKARVVVPGHGPAGGPELIAHTRALLGR